MMTTEYIILRLLTLILTAFVDLRASPLSSYQVKDSPGRQITRVKTVAVNCHESYMEIAIKSDFFDVGLPVDPSDLRLGVDSQFISSCKVTAFSANEYIITAELTDCGTQHWITDDSLIYTNLLIYTPRPSPDGVIHLEQAVVPIECYYSRRYNVTSNAIRPTWIPYGATQSAVEDLQFSLRLMTNDWRFERASSVYFLGDYINIEASVQLGHHMNLRVYIESCVATVDPDINSVPRYTFIENHGCLMDGQKTSSKSRFLTRTQTDKLQLQLDSFKFHQETRPEMYITCTLEAFPVMDAVNPFHKACSFIDGSWRAADGDDWTCYNCQETKGFAPSFRSTLQLSVPPPATGPGPTSSSQKLNKIQPRIHNDSGISFSSLLTASEPVPSWRSIILPEEEDEEIGSAGWEQEKSVGPLVIFPKKSKMGSLAPPRVKEGVPPLPSRTKDKKPMPHSSLWKNGLTNNMDQEGDIIPPLLEPSEQPNITHGDPEFKMLEEEDEYDFVEGDDMENFDDRDDHDQEKKGEPKEAEERMWKAGVFPEEDFKGVYTTPAPKNEESEPHTSGTTPSLPDEEGPADIYHPSKDS